MKASARLLFIPLASGLLATPGISSGAIAMGSPTMVNVALNRPTFGDVAFGAPTSRGNDGIDGFADNGNWTHADYPNSGVPYPQGGPVAPNPYWEVDLEGTYDLDNFVVTDRVGCCDPSRLDGSTVTLFGAGNAIVGTATLSVAGGGGDVITLNNGGAGWAGVQRVRIDGTSGGAPIQYFQFSEFQAFSMVATPINWASGGTAQFFDAGGSPAAPWNTFPANNVIDGNLTSISHPLDQFSAGYFLEVDLGQEIFVDSLDLTGRVGCCADRLEDFTIEFLDGDGNVVHTMNEAGQTTVTENIDVIGSFGGNGPQTQTIRITNSNGAQYGPQVAELQVYGVAIPEPSSILLSLTGVLFLVRRRR
ncbi:MAG: discoidin domain-containing protein [Akkermansiaceae bacterium]